MFYLAQLAPQPPAIEITYPDNSNSKTLIDPSQLTKYVSDKEVFKSTTLLTLGEYNQKYFGGFNSSPNDISLGRLVYDVESQIVSPIPVLGGTINKGTSHLIVDAETGRIFGGSTFYNPGDATWDLFANLPPLPAQQNPQSVPEPPILLGIASVGMVFLLSKLNKRNRFVNS